jgi:hypothetical protein
MPMLHKYTYESVMEEVRLELFMSNVNYTLNESACIKTDVFLLLLD